MNKFTCRCNNCNRTTSTKYARQHGGKCKSCVTGIEQPRKPRSKWSFDDVAREGGYEDTMGVSPSALEQWY